MSMFPVHPTSRTRRSTLDYLLATILIVSLGGVALWLLFGFSSDAFTFLHQSLPAPKAK